MTRALDYAPPPPPRRTPGRYIRRTALVIVVLLFVGYWTSAAVTEHRLRREAARLLAANAPAVRWPGGTAVTFTAEGFLVLPDGQVARLEGMRRPIVGRPAAVDPEPVVVEAMSRLRAEAVGYTVVGSD